MSRSGQDVEGWFAALAAKTNPAKGIVGFGGSAWKARLPEPEQSQTTSPLETKSINEKKKTAKHKKAAANPAANPADSTVQVAWSDPTKASACEALLLSAERLEEEFSMSDLIVQAWRDCPIRFGLEGHKESFPDSNAIKVNLFSKKANRSPIFAGYFKSVRPATYSITPQGRRAIISARKKLISAT